MAATSVEWVVNSFTLNRKYKSYCTLQNICMSGLIIIMSLLKGGSHPQKMTVCGGGHEKKKRTEWGGVVIRNGGSKNSTSPPYLVKNERSLRWVNFIFFVYLIHALYAATFKRKKIRVKGSKFESLDHHSSTSLIIIIISIIIPVHRSWAEAFWIRLLEPSPFRLLCLLYPKRMSEWMKQWMKLYLISGLMRLIRPLAKNMLISRDKIK